jgi:hypothetical protein
VADERTLRGAVICLAAVLVLANRTSAAVAAAKIVGTTRFRSPRARPAADHQHDQPERDGGVRPDGRGGAERDDPCAAGRT